MTLLSIRTVGVDGSVGYELDCSGEEDRLRFAAHVLLVLRALVDEVDGDQSTAILWMYIRHLISTENGNDFSTGIAYYVAQLDARPLQIDAFAQYCAGLDGFAPGVTRVTICETGLFFPHFFIFIHLCRFGFGSANAPRDRHNCAARFTRICAGRL